MGEAIGLRGQHPVPGHQATAFQHGAPARVIEDGLGDGVRGDKHQVGDTARRDAVAVQAENAGRDVGDHGEGVRQILVGEEALPIADDGRPIQHVAVAIGPPGVADIVGSGEDRDAGRREAQHRRHGADPRCVGHDGDLGPRQRLGGPAEVGVVDGAEPRRG